MHNRHILLATFCLLTTFISSFSLLASEEDHHEQENTFPTGEHGGRLLTDGSLAVELVIAESAMAPELRVYTTLNGKAVAPEKVNMNITLARLAQPAQPLSLIAEKDYLVSEQSVEEPHSFHVRVKAKVNEQSATWEYEQHEGRTEISQRAMERAGIVTAPVEAGELAITDTLYGVIAPVNSKLFSIMATYPGTVESIAVNIGDRVTKGQPLLEIKNNRTLQNYTINSPADGVITERWVNLGEHVEERKLMELVDLSEVWVELSAFPENIENLKVGQQAFIYDLHHHKTTTGKVFYVAPMMTGGHIARARVAIENKQNHWRPGMHVKADIVTDTREAQVLVPRSAIQTLNGDSVVFIREGTVFQAQPVKTAAQSGGMIEVVGGLLPGMEIVIKNSFVIKADLLKSGASHAH